MLDLCLYVANYGVNKNLSSNVHYMDEDLNPPRNALRKVAGFNARFTSNSMPHFKNNVLEIIQAGPGHSKTGISKCCPNGPEPVSTCANDGQDLPERQGCNYNMTGLKLITEFVFKVGATNGGNSDVLRSLLNIMKGFPNARNNCRWCDRWKYALHGPCYWPSSRAYL